MNSRSGNNHRSRRGRLWACTFALMLGFPALVLGMPMVALTEAASPPAVPNMLLSFDSLTPEAIIRTVNITGLQDRERIMAIDVRPSTGQLYGLGITDWPVNTTSRLYMINPTTGVATQIGAMPFTVSLSGFRFGFDFNPVTDEIRIVSDPGQNLRIHPDTGQVIDADLLTPGIQTDSALVGISGALGSVPVIAHSNNFTGATSTTLYGVNGNDGRLVSIGDVSGSPISPNSGRLFSIGGPPIAAGPLEFDIAPTGEAFITRPSVYDIDFATPPFRIPQLVGVNLTTGTVTFERNIGTTSLQVIGLAVTPIQSGWWWNPNESGRGFSIEVSQNTLFMAGYLYDSSGRATWYTSAGPITNNTLYQGVLQSFGNGQTLSGLYKPYSLTNPNAGNVTIQFSDATHGTLTWPGGTIPIERYVFGAGASSFQPESGWWWNESESGRGFTLEVQGNKLFIGGYMYDDPGNPIWYISAGNMTSATLYQGQWEQYANGQTLTGLYQKPDQVNGNVGSITVNFTSRSTATLTLPDGRQIPLTRYRF